MRLIDADALTNDILRRWNTNDDTDFANKEVWKALEEAPTIYAVHVVRCKDCVHCEKETMTCTIFIKNRLGDDFCSEGER